MHYLQTYICSYKLYNKSIPPLPQSAYRLIFLLCSILQTYNINIHCRSLQTVCYTLNNSNAVFTDVYTSAVAVCALQVLSVSLLDLENLLPDLLAGTAMEVLAVVRHRSLRLNAVSFRRGGRLLVSQYYRVE